MSALDTAAPAPAPAKRSWINWLVWLSTEDHCEWANRYVYWLKTPLGILSCCAFFALLCGLFVAPQAYLLLAVIAAVVVVGIAWPGIAVKGLRCRLVYTARRGREGKPTQAKLIVTNRWPWPVWGLAVDDPAFALATQTQDSAGEATVALARINGWSRCTYKWTFVPPRRGVYPSQEVRIVTGFPFGLRRASRPVEVDRGLTAWPETFWLPPLEERNNRRDWGGELCESLVGSDGMRVGVRDYREGDNLRDVHWAKSARHERLIVSEREASVVDDYRVVVDVDPDHHAGVGSDSTLEWSLKIAASICESVIDKRGRVELWLGGERYAAGGRPEALEALLDGVARFEANAPTLSAAKSLSSSASASVISIGTDASGAMPGRRIVLQRAASSSTSLRQENASESWITVDATQDVPGQVLQGWRSERRSRRRAT